MNINSLLRYVEAKKRPASICGNPLLPHTVIPQTNFDVVLRRVTTLMRFCSPAKSSLGVLRTANGEDASRCLWQMAQIRADDDNDSGCVYRKP